MYEEQDNNADFLVKATALQAELSEALVKHPVTCDAIIEVIVDRNLVTLVGTVDDPEVREAAVTIASEHPQVISVTNSLKTSADQEILGT